MQNLEMSYSTREQWLQGFVDKSRPVFDAAGTPLPLALRVSVSSPSVNSRRKSGHILGECYATIASTDGHNEIFIIASIADPVRIADVLTHELCHAGLDNHGGHGKEFKKLALAVGLQGKMTATTAGPEWFRWATPILDELGPMPYAAISATSGDAGAPKKKRPTYGLKLECPDCGWLARVTKKHVEPHSHLECPVPSCYGTLAIEGMGDDTDETDD